MNRERKPLPYCPRCGKKNGRALSRRANVTICDACGMMEAIEDYLGQRMPLEDWYISKITKAKERNGKGEEKQ